MSYSLPSLWMAVVDYIGYSSTLNIELAIYTKEYSQRELRPGCYMTTNIRVFPRWTQCHTLIIGLVPGDVKTTGEKSTQFPF